MEEECQSLCIAVYMQSMSPDLIFYRAKKSNYNRYAIDVQAL